MTSVYVKKDEKRGKTHKVSTNKLFYTETTTKRFEEVTQ